jgi:hypothetical protein
MARTPFSAPIPRVPRSRRDARYDPGSPMPPKRAAAGYVVSVQDDYDTVTVDVLDEQLTGVIPLGDMPPVGAIVEVESRGDLLVIPVWYPGPPTSLTVDLPAHNVTNVIAGTPTEIVGGPEALATHDPSSYVRLTNVGSSFNVGYNDTGDPEIGFGVWEQPPGTTVLDYRFVAEGYRDGGLATGDVDDDTYNDVVGPDQTIKPVLYWPFVQVRYGGDPFPSFGGYNLSGFPVDEVGETIAPGTINLGSFCIAPGEAPAYDKGLAPAVDLTVYPFPWPDVALVITYLAVRITYTTP